MKALYAGSFDPFTKGHLDIVNRALMMFDSLVIGVGYNEHKKGEWPVAERVKAIAAKFSGDPRVEVASYSGLTVEFARSVDAGVLVRGVRGIADFEKEKELADINMQISGIPTVIIPGAPELSFVSSSMVRELIHNGYDVSAYLGADFPLGNKNY